jgi:hypothetical protein
VSKALAIENLINLIIYIMRIALYSEVDLVKINYIQGRTVYEIALTSKASAFSVFIIARKSLVRLCSSLPYLNLYGRTFRGYKP